MDGKQQHSEEKRQRQVTPHGEVDVDIMPDGRGKYYPLKTEKLAPLPDSFKVSHRSEMGLFHSILMYIKKNYPNRSCPVTQKEFIKSGADPRILNQLLELGMLKSCYIPIRDSRGVNTGSRACLYYTEQGRALIREYYDPSYALTDNTGELDEHRNI